LNIRRYFERIGYSGSPRPDLDTLKALHTAHVFHVPFENLDVQLGHPLTTDVPAAYAKIVERGRGGWCYEQNGLLGWALAELGFRVTRIAGAVMRQVRGAAATASHLCLLVRVPASGRDYVVDVGFGGSLLEPIEVAEARHHHAPFGIRLTRIDDDYWRFEEQVGEEWFGFDFRTEHADEGALAGKCEDLQTSEDSPFVLNTVVQQRSPGKHASLRGRVLTTITTTGTQVRLLDSAEEFTRLLTDTFGLDLPEAACLWPRILERHEQLGLQSSPGLP
jgi:N-hydroxyarylamine O-acetyltransferase